MEEELQGLMVQSRAPMRRVAMLPLCLALLQAFVMAPYQHVHLHHHRSEGHEGEADHDHHHHDHDDAAVVHIHLYAFSVPGSSDEGASLEESHEGHASVALDSFATLTRVVVPALVKPLSQMLRFPPEESVAEIVEVIEPCGHDPPSLDFSAPRAPPV